ncbi:MAG: tyrosine-type recombinase/integrase [Aristaeellaceae bacterium]
MTLGEWLSDWYQLYIDPLDLAKSTKQMYNRAIRGIPPILGACPLDQLTVFDIRRWLIQVAAVHPRAAQLYRVMILRAMTVAVKAGLVPQSLCDPDLLPVLKHRARKASVLTQSQLRAYFLAACDDPATLALAFMACGLRRSEALGVTWAAVDLSACTLAVVGQRLPGEDRLSPCKTASSVRTLALPERLRQSLLRCPRPLAGGFICLVSHRQVYRLHDALLQRLGLPRVTLHGLRHSFATAAVLDGVPIKVLQLALGHATYQITADLYADHLPPVSPVSRSVFSA